MIHPRIAIGALMISAGALVGIAQHEDYVEVARPPVAGDVPTNGFGTTTNPDGSPVKNGDRTTPVRALVRLYADADKYSQAVKRCAPVPMHQHEFDAYVGLTYNIGPGAFCSSSIPRLLKAGEYARGCETIRLYVCGPATEKTRAKAGERCYKKDKPLRVLRGLDVRRQAEYKTCMGHGA